MALSLSGMGLRQRERETEIHINGFVTMNENQLNYALRVKLASSI
jgi:hypothetical protein